MKKIIILLSVFLPIISNAQEENQRTDTTEKHVYLGLTGGLDYDLNAYQFGIDNNKEFEYYGINPHYNLGLSFGFDVTKRIRPRLGVYFLTMSYGFNWSDDYPDFDKTEASLYYMGLNLNFDYMVLSRGNFNLYISPGIKGETYIRRTFETSYTNGDPSDNRNFDYTEAYPDKFAGCGISAIFKYNVLKYLGLEVIPEYTHFINGFVKSNDKPYQRFNINFGIEFNL